MEYLYIKWIPLQLGSKLFVIYLFKELTHEHKHYKLCLSSGTRPEGSTYCCYLTVSGLRRISYMHHQLFLPLNLDPKVQLLSPATLTAGCSWQQGHRCFKCNQKFVFDY